MVKLLDFLLYIIYIYIYILCSTNIGVIAMHVASLVSSDANKAPEKRHTFTVRVLSKMV